MSTTIEQLELEVKSSSGSAVSGIESLSNSLAKLKTATKGGVGLRTVANQLTALNGAMKGVDGSAAAKISTLATSLEKLKNLGNLKISSTIASGITAIGTAASSIGATDFSSIDRLSTALQSLSNFSAQGFAATANALGRLPAALQSINNMDFDSVSDSLQRLSTSLESLGKVSATGFTSVINALSRLPKVTETLSSLDLVTFTNQIERLSNALSPLSSKLDTIGNAFGRLPSNLRSAISATNKLAEANEKASTSYINLYAKAKMAIAAVRGVANVIAGWINSANTYIEDMNRFNVSLGEYASQAQEYAERVSELVGIDPGDFMGNQATFNTIIKGFGVASDKAYLMSQNLTQLGYDISSFADISVSDAMAKLESGIAGELEPLRRIGYDLSVARLQQEAYNLGIEKSVSAMTQAEKSQLRYYAIMTQVTDAQGDMARTLNSPANQLRILQAQVEQCARALGNVFLPILSAILPYAIAAAKAIRLVAEAIASLFGFKLADFSVALDGVSTSIGGISTDAGDVADGLGDAAKSAKKLKTTLLGIDELNVFPATADSSGSGAGGVGVGGAGGDLGIDLPTYDFLDGLVDSNVNKIFEEMKSHLKEICELAATIGAAFAAWKIATGVMDFLKYLSSFKGFSGGIGALGLTMLLSDMNEFKKYLDDFITNGASFQNVVGMISEFAGMLGDAFVILGNLKLGGALKIIQGVGEICVAIKDISENGINWTNVSTIIRGISNVAIGLGLVTGNFKVVGVGLVLQGISEIIPQIQNVITAIKTGDWSVVDWSDLVIGAIEIIGGIALALGAFKGLGAVGKMTQTATAMTEVTTATTVTSSATEVLNGASTGFSSKLTSLAKNLLLGIAIIAEVAVAAMLIVGSIAVLGLELQLVGEAWSPVIENATVVATAMGAGIAMLVVIGAVTAQLGTTGVGMCAQLGIGIAVLAEVSVAADLFIAEIAAMGALLDLVGQTWTPVIANAPTIAAGIATGTALLVAIGVATAALGAATVASAGTLPIAIGLGTAMLVLLAGAFVLFCESLVAVADELSQNLAPALIRMNGQLPGLTTNMQNFTQFMTNFADEVVAYTKASAISGLAGTIETIIGWFTGDPIQKMADEVNQTYESTKQLNEKLNLAVPELETAVGLLTSYGDFLGRLNELANCNIELSSSLYLNLYEIGQNIVTGFAEGVQSMSGSLTAAGTTFVTTLLTSITTAWVAITTFFTTSLLAIQTQMQTTWLAIQTNTIMTWTAIQTFLNTTWLAISTLTSATLLQIQTNMTTTLLQIQTNITTTTTTIVTTLTTAWTTAVTTTTMLWTQMVSMAQQKFTEICTVTQTKMNEATNIIKSIQWGSLGTNLVRGLLDGLKSEWSEVMSWAREAAAELTATMQVAFDINSPSKVWAEIGKYLDLGLQEGLQGGESGLVSTATQLADSVTGAASSAMEVPTTTPSYQVDTASFSPDTVGSDSTGGITTILEQMLAYMQSDNRSSDVKVNIDGREVFNAVVKQNNRAIQRTGVSPIRV